MDCKLSTASTSFVWLPFSANTITFTYHPCLSCSSTSLIWRLQQSCSQLTSSHIFSGWHLPSNCSIWLLSLTLPEHLFSASVSPTIPEADSHLFHWPLVDLCISLSSRDQLTLFFQLSSGWPVHRQRHTHTFAYAYPWATHNHLYVYTNAYTNTHTCFYTELSLYIVSQIIMKKIILFIYKMFNFRW